MNKENIRRRIRNITAFAAALLLAAAFTLPAGTEIMGDSFGNAIVASAAEEASGTCGTDLKWALDDAGTLTISYTGSGSGGSMQNWTYNDYCQRKIPWTNYQKSIKSVVIGDNVTSIGDYAFYSCSNITSVDMVSVTSIGQRAFSYCTSLSSITIPDSVTSIGGFAFSDCKSLSSITIPDSVTSIGELAFQMCTSLTSITIQSGVTSIGNGVFSNCNSLSNIIVDEGNTMFSSENGVLFDKNKTKLIRYPINKSGDSYDIPNSVTSIGVSAFASCKNLASITIPSSVTAIESEAFQECTSLTSITIPDSVTSIGDHAFESCSSLTSITIPNSVTSIGEFAFCECSSLTSITIPDSVNSIGDFAFYKCSSLTSITIPNSVTSIGNIAFESCSSLESIIIPKDLDITNSGIPASASQIKYSDDDEGNITITSVTLGEGKTSLTIPETIDGKSVSSIADTAFEKCEALESIIIPKDLDITTAGIPSSASQIKYTVDNENVIATVAALGSGQASLTIPDTIDGKNVTTVYIKDGTTVKAPASAAQIKYTVDNEGNITITSVTLGESQTSLTISETIGGKTVTSIENNALADCSNLESIIIPKDIDITNAGIPDTTTQIRYTVDNENVTITAVTLGGDATGFVLPDKIGGKAVTNIANGALASCPDVSHEHREKTAATCTAKAVCAICETGYGDTLEHTRESHGMCTVCHDGAEECGENAYYVFDEEKGTLTIFGTGSVTKNDWVSEEFSNSAKNIVIESGITDFDNINCFMEVESISYPDTFITINTHVFQDSHSLTSITIDENNENYCAVDNVIFSKDKTKLYCYLRNNPAEKYDIPEGVTSIEERAFNNCKYLKNITIPSGVQNIGVHAFELCINLESITLPSSVKSVGSYAFYDCNNLKTIFIPDGTDVSEAGIPDTTTKVFYSTDDSGNASITSIALGTEKTTVNIPETIDGNKVISVEKDYQQCVGDHTHFGGTATCESKAVCELCGGEYGEMKAHSLTKHDAVSASCTTAGNIEYYECNVCGKLFEDANGEKETTPEAVTILATGHNFGENWESKTEGHYQVCTVCGEKSDIEAHIQDNGTVTKEATLTENGTITYKCTVCGAKMGEETITATISSFEVTANNVIVYYTVTGSTEVKSQTLNFSEVTEEMVELMKSKDIKLVIDFVNYSTAGSDTIILTAAQMKAIEYVLAHDFVIES